MALGALDILYVELARGVLHLGGNWAGYLNAAIGIGAVLAVLVTARLVGRRGSRSRSCCRSRAGRWGSFGLARHPGLAAVAPAARNGRRRTVDRST